jgi:hypothetical protein
VFICGTLIHRNNKPEIEMTTEDNKVIASVIRYLKAETGAVSANVHLPSGKNVVVYATGEVK